MTRFGLAGVSVAASASTGTADATTASRLGVRRIGRGLRLGDRHIAADVDPPAGQSRTSGVSVPIDCQAAYGMVVEDLNQWVEGGSDIHRTELEQLSLTNFSCSGNRVQISTSARAVLPFRLPHASTFVEIHATVEAQSDRVR